MRGVWFGLATLDVLAFFLFLIVLDDPSIALLVGVFAIVFVVLGIVEHDEASPSAEDTRIDDLDETVKALEERIKSMENNRKS